MRTINVLYNTTVAENDTTDLKGRSFIVTDAIAADLYGYEAGTETTPENIDLIKTLIDGLEVLEGNTAGEIQSIG